MWNWFGRIVWRRILSITITTAGFFLSGIGCDSFSPSPYDNVVFTPTDQDLILSSVPKAAIRNDTHSLALDKNGWVRDGKQSPYAPSIESISYLYGAGLWLYAEQDIPRANMTFMAGYSSYRIARSGSTSVGIFVLTEDSLRYPISNWPIEFAAPTTIDGQPRLYGQMMGWARYELKPELLDLSHPIPNSRIADPILGLELGVSVYFYNVIGSQNYAFVRYDLINTTDEAINDLYVGYQTDTDLWATYPNRQHCDNQIGLWDNATAYDETLSLSYTYNLPDSTHGAIPSDCYGIVTGFMFLQTPHNGDAKDHTLAHTIFRKNRDGNFPGFGEIDYSEPRQIGLALKGYSAMGEAMIDPTTGAETKFAFTGDPVSGSGWIDRPRDIRSLLSIQPFSILPGEKESITIVWIVTTGTDLENAINQLKSEAERLRSSAILLTY